MYKLLHNALGKLLPHYKKVLGLSPLVDWGLLVQRLYILPVPE